MPRPIWFEIPADDVSRAVRFYETVFGWQMKEMAGWPDYWLIMAEPAPQAAVGGAVMSRKQHGCIRNTIDMPSLDEAFAKIKQAGGRVVGERMPIPGGEFAVCADTEGNEFGVMAPTEGEAPKRPEPTASPLLHVVHFDIPADDPERAIKFYESVFGWHISKWDGPMDYWLVSTGEASESGMNGGIAQRQDGECGADTVSVPDVDEYAAKVKAAGGKITMEKNEIPKVGWMAMCEDTEGNSFGIIQTMDEAAM